jgi:hypothetical protein
MTNPGIIKLVGNTFVSNSTNVTANSTYFGTIVPMEPTNTGSGATLVRVLNTTTGLVTITVANNGVNVGTIQLLSNTDYFLAKNSQDGICSNSTAGGVQFTPIAKYW